MAEPPKNDPGSEPRERRDRDRDRRAVDRRSPAGRSAGPSRVNRWLYAVAAVLGLAVVVLLLRGGGADTPERDLQPEELGRASPMPVADTLPPPGGDLPTTVAATGDYERLVAEGEGAAGRRVVVQLYCEAVTSVSLRVEVQVSASVAALADAAGRVPAARCRWGRPGEGPDFLLLVPPELATEFGNAPLIEESFVRRKSIRGEIEWIGRSDALALRTAGVLLDIR
jgi:hypothetical protein